MISNIKYGKRSNQTEKTSLGDSVYRLAETHRLTYEKYRLSDIFPLPTELLDKDVVITQKRLIRK